MWVGVFSTKEKAIEAEKQHNKYKHLHSHNVDVDEVSLDKYQKSYREGEKDHTKKNWICSLCGEVRLYAPYDIDIYSSKAECYKCKKETIFIEQEVY